MWMSGYLLGYSYQRVFSVCKIRSTVSIKLTFHVSPMRHAWTILFLLALSPKVEGSEGREEIQTGHNSSWRAVVLKTTSCMETN